MLLPCLDLIGNPKCACGEGRALGRHGGPRTRTSARAATLGWAGVGRRGVTWPRCAVVRVCCEQGHRSHPQKGAFFLSLFTEMYYCLHNGGQQPRQLCSVSAHRSRERSPNAFSQDAGLWDIQDLKANSPTVLNQACSSICDFSQAFLGKKIIFKKYLYFRPILSVSMGNWTRGV